MSSIQNALLRINLVPLMCLMLTCSSVYPASPQPTISAAQDSDYSGEPISMQVVRISVADFFRAISELSGLNILIDPEVSGLLTLNVEQVPWDQLFDAVVSSQGLAKKIEGNLIRITTLERRQQLQEAELLATELLLISRRLNYAQGNTIMGSLASHLTPRGNMNVDDRTNTLIITDTPEGLKQVTDLIEILDVPEKQVEIEARIVEASTSFASALGVQFGFGIGRLGANVLTDNPGFAPRNENRVGGFLATLPYTQAPGLNTVLGLTTGNLLDTIQLDALITAAERDGEAQILSKPRVTALNNAQATITQGSQVPVPVSQNFTTTVEFQTAALELMVTPQVTSINTILLDIKVSNNIPDFGTTVMGIPAIRTSEAQTQVLVADGGTTVIGGIYIESESENQERVPGLSRVPLLGNLFKTTSTSTETREILFFLTARIQKTPNLMIMGTAGVQETGSTDGTDSAPAQE